MAKIFDLRGTFNAWYADGHPGISYHGTVDPIETTNANGWTNPETGTKTVIDLNNSTAAGISWAAHGNYPSTNKLSVRVTLIPKASSLTFAVLYEARNGSTQQNTDRVYLYTGASGFGFSIGVAGTTYGAVANTGTLSFTANQLTELMFTWDGDTGDFYCSQDGVEVSSGSGSASPAFDPGRVIFCGCGFNILNTTNSNFYLVNHEVWDSVENHVYSARTGFDATPKKRINESTNVGASNIRFGSTQNFQGNTITGTAYIPSAGDVRSGTNVDATTGTLAVPAAGDVQQGVAVDNTTGTFVVPAENTVKSGTQFGAAGTEFTGSLVSTDPGVANVRSGTNYTIENDAKVGTLVSGDVTYKAATVRTSKRTTKVEVIS